MALKPKTLEVFEYLKANGKCSMEDLVTATGRPPRSISGSITALHNQGLADRIKEDGVVYAMLTDAGENFVPDEE